MNYDIIQLHNEILDTFEKEKGKLLDYEKQYEILSNTNYMNFSPKYRQNINNSIEKLKKHIHDIQNNVMYNYFTLETMFIISQYKELLSKPIIISFFGTSNNDDINTKKKKLFDEYIQIAKKYVDIKTDEEEFKEKTECSVCNSQNFYINENESTCKDCGIVEEILNVNSCLKDIDRINISIKYSYDRQIHFKECINKFQGKYTYIEPKVFEDLERSFKQNGLVKNEDYSKVTKQHILLFLKENGHVKHYYDVNYLYSYYTKTPPNDISHIEQKILEDFNELVELYEKEYKNDTTRKNFINTHYVLFQLLRRHKYPCNKEDFNMLKTYEKRIYHDDVIQHLFMILNWNYQPFI